MLSLSVSVCVLFQANPHFSPQSSSWYLVRSVLFYSTAQFIAVPVCQLQESLRISLQIRTQSLKKQYIGNLCLPFNSHTVNTSVIHFFIWIVHV